VTADGSFVAFASLAALVAADTNDAIDVYGRPVAGGGAGEQLEELQALVATVQLTKPLGRSLAAKLEAAESSLATGDVQGACEELDGFIELVTSQSGKRLAAETAAELLERARGIRAAIGCP
jgi:hypothetical protein